MTLWTCLFSLFKHNILKILISFTHFRFLSPLKSILSHSSCVSISIQKNLWFLLGFLERLSHKEEERDENILTKSGNIFLIFEQSHHQFFWEFKWFAISELLWIYLLLQIKSSTHLHKNQFFFFGYLVFQPFLCSY